MKCLVALSCLLAVASAGYLNHAAVGGVYGGALGYAHGSHAVAYNAPLVAAPHPVHVPYHGPLAHAYAAHTGPLAHGYAHGYAHAAPIAHAGLASEARLVDPVAIAAGAPLPTGDTVEVAAAKAAHLQAHAVAKSQHYGAVPVAHAVAAPLAHAYAAPIAHAYAAPIAHGYAHAGLASEARLIDPVAIAAGAPLPTGDTVEVAAAKAAHAAAHHAAKHGHYLAKRSPGYLHSAVAVAAPAHVTYAVAAPAHSYSYSHQVHHAAPLAIAHAAPLAVAHAAPLAIAHAAPLAYAGHLGYAAHHGVYHG